MGMLYEIVIESYEMYPTPVAIRAKNTGKSTAARSHYWEHLSSLSETSQQLLLVC